MKVPGQRFGQDQLAAGARIACFDDLGGEDLELRGRRLGRPSSAAPYI
jgi:hypothetical protein